jgi:hypothetical protein
MRTYSVWRAWSTDSKWNPQLTRQVTRLIELTGRGQHPALSTPSKPTSLQLTVFGHPARQLAATCTWAVDPQDVDTNTWRPALVSRT